MKRKYRDSNNKALNFKFTPFGNRQRKRHNAYLRAMLAAASFSTQSQLQMIKSAPVNSKVEHLNKQLAIAEAVLNHQTKLSQIIEKAGGFR